MFETSADLQVLQQLLDASYARAGAHLRSIWGEETRLDADALSTELAGVQVLDLATVTPRGEPRVAPVDGLFFRGQFWFGSAENSARFRNIRANPAVSGAISRGLETFLVLVHGRAELPRAGGLADEAAADLHLLRRHVRLVAEDVRPAHAASGGSSSVVSSGSGR